MFVLDDLALAPVRGFMWIVRELHQAAEREFEDEADRLTQQLRSLHLRLELGEITEDEFDEAEGAILERLDQLAGEDDHEAEHDPADDDEEGFVPEDEADEPGASA